MIQSHAESWCNDMVKFKVDDFISCDRHGKQKPGCVCCHLHDHSGIGFVQSSPRSYEAWCLLCDQVLHEEGDFTPDALAFMDFRLVCRPCFRAIKKLEKARRRAVRL